MTQKKGFLLLLIAPVIFYLLSFSQNDDPLARIIAGFDKYLKERPQEKIYIHFDRSYYAAGDTIWFKTYLTAGAFHEPSPLSRTIYVELIDKNKQLVTHLKLFSLDGSSAGYMPISDSLESGNYIVRAYTNWMRNSSEDYFFHRKIKIWNSEIPVPKDIPENNLDLQFFPEGGDLVHGIFSKVAIKATGTDGLGKRISGKILEGDKVIGEFISNGLGMGAFYMKPQKEKEYKARIDDYDKEVTLPDIKESGLAMSVNNSSKSDSVLVKILTTDHEASQTIYILAQTRGIVCYSARAFLNTNITIAKIPKSAFQSGIAQITVMDSNGIPLAERLIFMDQGDRISLKITPDKPTYAPRELVTLNIQAHDMHEMPLVANLSLAVYDNQQILTEENRETISSYLLLSSDLKGYIESPGYYFNPINEDREEALDYLLLTQGWRRYTVEDALNNNLGGSPYKVEQGLTIKGKMVDVYKDKPISGGKISLLSFFPAPETKIVKSNSQGEFEINNIIYFEPTDVVLHGETKKGNTSVKIITENSHDYPGTPDQILPFTERQTDIERTFVVNSEERRAIEKAFDFDEKMISLEEVEVLGKKVDLQSSPSKIYGSGSVNIQVAGVTSLENQIHPLQLIQGRVPGVQVRGSGTQWSVLIRGISSINGGTNPLIMIDDFPADIASLHTIPVEDIESVSVWKGPDASIFGARGANGVIGFYTKRGKEQIDPPKESPIPSIDAGFQIEREFYSPKYDIQKPEHIKPDKRVTLFWAPYILTDSSGRASISFYNHDVETSITGILEGISGAGISGASSFEYKITKE
ncbi:Outer membrane receptor proteins, mostly Fe transport [Aquiflexum balticum DSM 16537]|uniref:Outer membrane receptor proteins, mostly Fe transport n=1 Tax=Aquiflexum balticum DSM 16537 TaxID=758820 RepID=A0A1W2H1S6_9BACT|nr:TonB-dependent receptor plug domain-containing protein [Aquiflexum balticum]SMD42714.1 Outer membrane receptor proteins, mostly Fe transport [Aquiflexum balticum DSM 16537]